MDLRHTSEIKAKNLSLKPKINSVDCRIVHIQ